MAVSDIIPYFRLKDKKISIKYCHKSIDNWYNTYYTVKAVGSQIGGLSAKSGS